jgi:hypothetical protein
MTSMFRVYKDIAVYNLEVYEDIKITYLSLKQIHIQHLLW